MTVFSLHSEHAQKTWVDEYGHINEVYYLATFANATLAFQNHFKIGIDYYDQSSCAIITLETHIRYLEEVRFPANIIIKSLIFGSDAKRIHFGHIMEVDGRRRATVEFMMLHYDTKLRSAVEMPHKVQLKLKSAEIPNQPDWVGHGIQLDRGTR